MEQAPNGASAAGPAPAQAAAGASPSPAPPVSVLGTLQDLWRDLPGLLSDRIELLSLELQRAGAALVQIVVLLIAAAIVAVTVWLVLWSVIVIVLMALGLRPVLALLLVLVLNLAVVAWTALRVRHLLPQLALPATRRHMSLTPSKRPSARTAAPAPPASPSAPQHEHPDLGAVRPTP